MRAPEIAREALVRSVLCTLYSYCGILALGLVGLVVYNVWNQRKMKENREAQDEDFSELFEEDKTWGSVLSPWDSSYERPFGRREPTSSIPEGVESGLDMRGRRRESGNTMSTLEQEFDTTDERYRRQARVDPPTLHHPYGETVRRRSLSSKSRESWEA